MIQDKKKLIWRKFIKYKIIEILFVLLIIPAYYFISILTDWILRKFGMDPNSYVQAGFVGIVVTLGLVVIVFFIGISIDKWIRFNWKKATETVEQELENKKEA